MILCNTSTSYSFIIEVTKYQHVEKTEETTKMVVEEEKSIVVEKIVPETLRGI